MIYKIPVTNDAYSTFTTTINKQEVEIKTRYNNAMGIFLLDIKIFETEQQVLGIPITSGIDLLGPFHFNLGTIYGYESSNEASESNRENFGINYLLLTEPPDDR